jgi:hypothetical protein
MYVSIAPSPSLIRPPQAPPADPHNGEATPVPALSPGIRPALTPPETHEDSPQDRGSCFSSIVNVCYQTPRKPVVLLLRAPCSVLLRSVKFAGRFSP